MKAAIKLFPIYLLTFIVACCHFNDPNKLEFEIDPVRLHPTTKKEWDFKHECENKGFSNVEFFIPIPAATLRGSGRYRVTLSSGIYVDSNNVDRVADLHYELANRLYREIVEDSILDIIQSIDVTIKCQKSRSLRTYNWKYYGPFPKDSLEKWNGFKVVKMKKGVFKRVQLKN